MGEISIQVENAVKEAIKMEINGRDFYNHAAEVTHNELGKKMFQKLAQEEIKHIETFSRLISSILKGENWKSYIRDDELKGKSQLVEELASRMKHAEGKSEIEALSIAMELEEKGIEFYKKSAGEVDDPQAREIFKKMCEEEKFHYDMLQAQHDSLTNSGFWFDSAEFKMDGKY